MGIFNLFSKHVPEKPQDVKTLREALLFFIRQELQKMEGGEGHYIKGFDLFINCLEEERFLFDAAVFFEDQERFKNEVQRIADDFAIDLPEKWTMNVIFTKELPGKAIKMKEFDVALAIKIPEHVEVKKSTSARLRILSGDAENKEYIIHANGGRLNIGRDRKTQDQDGFVRENHVAFPDSSSNQGNKYISRQHAHIDWNKDLSAFVLFADEGGVPPRNKVKIRSTGEHNVIKLTFTELGHTLLEGDQIILGESAILEFSYLPAD